MSDLCSVTLPGAQIPAGWLIGPQSFLMDRFTPECERIFMPSRDLPGTDIRFGLRETTDPDPLHWLKQWPRQQETTERIIFDVRRLGPQNWAHTLNDILPLMFYLCTELDLDPDQLLIVVPLKTRDFIIRVFEALGVAVLKSDLRPKGRHIHFEVPLYHGLRASRAAWAALPKGRALIEPLIAKATSDLPRKVFLSRRDTRALDNEAEVSACLRARGYKTIYPEDLSVEDQFRLFRDIEDVVAIHGAGLAPMLYSPPGGRFKRLVEILPCGHMTDNFRGLAHLIGTPWIGVRGRIAPGYAPAIYNLQKPFLRHSLDNFHVDTASLEIAFEMFDTSPPMP